MGHYPIHVTQTVHPYEGYELVIVPTKHYHLIDTLKQIVPQAGGADHVMKTAAEFGFEMPNLKSMGRNFAMS